MKLNNGTILLSPSDMVRYSACRHATRLDLDHMNGQGPEPAEDSEDMMLLSEQGFEHEQRYMDYLTSQGKQLTQIKSRTPERAVAQTKAAMARGDQVIVQGALAGPGWVGYPDFLERIEEPSDFGPWSYEVVDTKLKKKADPKHVLQLVVYSDLVERAQGLTPKYAHLQLGTGERSTHCLAEYADYVRGLQTRLESFVQDPVETRPVPCPACELCRWRNHCGERWEAEDSLYLVADIRKSQVEQLEAAGIKTITALARYEGSVKRLVQETLDKIRAQARLQVARKTGLPRAELRPHVNGKGFDLLPQPREGDLFYDIEGDPHYRERDEEKLEYLHGVWDSHSFKAFWAHNHAEEHAALKSLFEFFRRRIKKHPQAHIYHYAPYEITALRRITMRHGFGEAEFDQWQRERRFVDLYAVVRGGIYASEKGYSLKDLEVFYDLPRQGDVKTSGGSVVAYEEWRKLEADDPKARAILDDLAEYNKIDCISTEYLRNWLLDYRPDDQRWRELGDAPSEMALAKVDEENELKAYLEESCVDEEHFRFFFDLCMFHRRESKPAAWAVFDAMGKDTDELIENLDCLADLTAVGPSYPDKRSFEREYGYPKQETKIRPGKRPQVYGGSGKFVTVHVRKLDRAQRRIVLRVGNPNQAILSEKPLHLLPSFAINTDVIRNAIKAVISDQLRKRRYRAAGDLLLLVRDGELRTPRFKSDSPISDGYDNIVDKFVKALLAMDRTVLPVQGPPGTGKTYVGARGILSLVNQGFRVAVTSNSHAAIRNVLLECDDALKERYGEMEPEDVSMVHRYNGPVSDLREPTRVPTASSNKDPRIQTAQVVGGTAWLMCREELTQSFDYLFVDEAGQVSLANLVGMARCARNLVLIGDPCQLPQVIQAAHPHPVYKSSLEWIIGTSQVIKKEQGLLLEESCACTPELCRYISRQFYEDRLKAYETTRYQAIHAKGLPEAGAYRVEVRHEGRMQVCEEEIDAIKLVVRRLVGGKWTDRDRETRRLGKDDIIVVAPFNAQVNALTDALDGISVGTVDKFQGQEAPVALVSMTSSTAEDAPRGLEFLLSRQRLNVALSRGKALSLAFASPRLLESRCATVEHLRLVNALCALEPLPRQSEIL